MAVSIIGCSKSQDQRLGGVDCFRWPIAIHFGISNLEDTQSCTGGTIAVAGIGDAKGAVIVVTAVQCAGQASVVGYASNSIAQGLTANMQGAISVNNGYSFDSVKQNIGAVISKSVEATGRYATKFGIPFRQELIVRCT